MYQYHSKKWTHHALCNYHEHINFITFHFQHEYYQESEHEHEDEKGEG